MVASVKSCIQPLPQWRAMAAFTDASVRPSIAAAMSASDRTLPRRNRSPAALLARAAALSPCMITRDFRPVRARSNSSCVMPEAKRSSSPRMQASV